MLPIRCLVGAAALRLGAAQCGGGGGGGGPACVDAADYTGASMLGAVCTSSTPRTTENNHCFRDDALVAKRGEFTTLYLGGCPDHAIFEPGVVAKPKANATAAAATCGAGYPCRGAASCGSGSGAASCGAGCGGATSCGAGCGSAATCGAGCSCGGASCRGASCGGASCSPGGGCGGGNSSSSYGSASCASRRLQYACGSCGSTAAAVTACGCASAFGCYCGSCGGADVSQYGIFTPHFHAYEVTVPSEPQISTDTPVYPTSSTLEAGDPIGFAVNGVPIFGEHRHVDTAGKVTATFDMNADACGGHGDRAHRYHYHSAPLCLLRLMGSTAPSSPRYLVGEGSWPSKGAPSPLLGLALDGFPIYGPYGADGLLVRHGVNLGACNFNNDTSSYHFAAEAPFAPNCLRGDVGVRVTPALQTKTLAGRCPLRGVVAGYCLPGVPCAIRAKEACSAAAAAAEETNWFQIIMLGVFSVVAALILRECFLIYRTAHAANGDFQFRRNLLAQRMHPVNIGLSSVMGSVVLLLTSSMLLQKFFNNSSEKVQIFQNDSTAAYLSVTGVLYALVIAQAFSQVSQRLHDLNMAIVQEAGALHRVFLNVLSLAGGGGMSSAGGGGTSLAGGGGRSDAHNVEKGEIFKTLHEYLSITLGELQTGVVDPSPLAMLYGLTTPLASMVLRAERQRSLMQVETSNRIMEAIADVASSRYARGRLERENMHWGFYVLNLLLCNAMFFGVLLIHSGSMALNLTYCFICVSIIGATSNIVADIDDPHRGAFQSDHVDVERLLLDVKEVATESRWQDDCDLAQTITRARHFAASIAAQHFLPSYRIAKEGSERQKKLATADVLSFGLHASFDGKPSPLKLSASQASQSRLRNVIKAFEAPRRRSHAGATRARVTPAPAQSLEGDALETAPEDDALHEAVAAMSWTPRPTAALPLLRVIEAVGSLAASAASASPAVSAVSAPLLVGFPRRGGGFPQINGAGCTSSETSASSMETVADTPAAETSAAAAAAPSPAGASCRKPFVALQVSERSGDGGRLRGII